MKWINVGDIKNWTIKNNQHCRQTLPELIRRLVLATCNSIEKISFPSGNSIDSGGWDGLLKTNTDSPFFPCGSSVWEIGAGASPGKKADTDYKKRTLDPLGYNPKENTFVFVTSRPWPDRNKWEQLKRSENIWQNVRVIAADDLGDWLDSAPEVSKWLAKQIGKVVTDSVQGIQEFWEEWSSATNPEMTADLVLSGRTDEMNMIHNWIAKNPDILKVQGDSPDETLAFLFASIMKLPENDRIRAISRCILVNDLGDLRSCISAFNLPLIIVASSQCIEGVGSAISKGHHIFLCIDARIIETFKSVRLSRPRKGIVEQALQDCGIASTRAQRLARDFGRSIPVLRRELSRSNVVRAPFWANGETALLLLPVLLAGSWDENVKGDRQVIEALSGGKYNSFTRKLNKLLAAQDSPINRIGSIWMLKSPLDAWYRLASHLDDDFLKLAHRIYAAVLTETDPIYDLPSDKRWAAAIYGKVKQYSGWIRSGIVESLVLLAVYGNRSPNVKSTQSFTNSVIHDTLISADSWQAWASISDVTPLLAEAGPNSFIKILEKKIEENPQIFQKLMQDEGDAIFGGCNHSGLLWALESTAWHPDYFAFSVDLLYRLAKIDVGEQYANRPLNSLKDIFGPRYPQTYATPEARLDALDRLISENPVLVWQFAKEYYDKGIFSESSRFRWRESGGDRKGLEPEDIKNQLEYSNGLQPRLYDLACTKENLISTVDIFLRLPPELKKQLLNVLANIESSLFSKEERSSILEKIRNAVNWINSYGDETIRIHVPGLNGILEKFEPDDILECVGWLLSDPWPKLPRGYKGNYNAYQKAVAEAQKKAARDVLNEKNLQQIINFSQTAQYPGVLGDALGRAVEEHEDESVLDALIEDASSHRQLVIAYASARASRLGSTWVTSHIKRLKSQRTYPTESLALLFLGLPAEKETWTLVAAEGKDIDRAYWEAVIVFPRRDLPDQAVTAIGNLLKVRRPFEALKIAGDPKASLPSSLLKRLIQELLSNDSDSQKQQNDSMTTFYLGNIFNQLHNRNELSLEEIAQLEWPFVSLFDNIIGDKSKPMAIHRVLQRNPMVFVQFTSYIYKREDRTPSPDPNGLDEAQLHKLANNARELLDSWHLIPGFKDDGSINEKELKNWVITARKYCAKNKIVNGGDLEIAKMLSTAPNDPDGGWPHTAVCNLIECLKNRLIEQHIPIYVYNSRGATSRGLSDGGKQERELSKNYIRMSEKVKAKWPRTAAMLRSMAESYEDDAKRQDIKSELIELRWE